MRRSLFLAALLAGTQVLLDFPLAAEGAPESILGQAVAPFSLQDHRGKDYSLDDFREKKLVVLAFVGTECPLARLYGPRLAELAAEFEPKGVAFLAVDSNPQDALSDLARWAKETGAGFPVLKDVHQDLADALKAERTPEVFVLDEERKVRYHGRVDDQFGVGFRRPQPTRTDLAIALNELLEGKDVTRPETETPGCIIGRPKPPAAGGNPVTWSNQISRLVQNRCQACHREGDIAPFALTSYEEAAGWASTMDEVVSLGRMPPWHANPEYGHFANDVRLTDDEKALIHQWVEAGAPEGDPAMLPPPRTFVEGWQMPYEPDVILRIRDEPYVVPAEGVVEYKYFTVDPGFTEDKWVKVAECLPDNKSVVHHIVALVRSPRSEGSPEFGGLEFLVGFAPGTRPFELPKGRAKLIPAGSQIIIQMHYTPNGTQQEDRSSIGLKFVDASEVTERVLTTEAINRRFRIPAGEDNVKVEAAKPVQRDVTLLSLFPHMHLRGKAFRYVANYPDGSTEILLDVPRYDFNWQNHFILAEPKILPKGTKIECTAWFDNSAGNLNNPDPAQDVRWGDQTWEEMMIGYFDVAIPVTKPSPDGNASKTE